MRNRMKPWQRIFMFAFALMLGGGVLAACESSTDDQHEQDVQIREQNQERANAVAPIPNSMTNFPIRDALIEFTLRQDLENHPWYTYLLGMNGNIIGYFISETYPVNACNMLSSSQKIVTEHEGTVIIDAPSLDGIYYGNSSCETLFFFDARTNAMVAFQISNYISTDQPLLLETDVPQFIIEGGQQPTTVAPAASPVSETEASSTVSP